MKPEPDVPKVVILAGGLGTRMGEETEYKPKPMVHIGQQPILWHIMKIYSHYGFSDFVICLGYKGEVIKDYFVNYDIRNSDISLELGHKGITTHTNTKESGWKITLADTGINAMTGARVDRIKKYTDSNTFFLTYGDIVADVDIPDLLEFHKKFHSF